MVSHNDGTDPVIYLESVVCPATELKNACLLVEGKIFHIYFAGRLVNSGRFPFDQPLVIDGCLGRQRYLEVAVGTVILTYIYKPAGPCVCPLVRDNVFICCVGGVYIVVYMFILICI